MNKNNLKKSLDRKIGEKPLFTNADRERFYEWKQNANHKKRRFTAFPKVVSALFFICLVSGFIYYAGSDNPFQQPLPPEQSADKENQEQNESNNPIDYSSKVNPRSEEIKEDFSYDLTLQEAKSLFGKYGEGLTYDKTNKSTGKTNLTSEFVYFKSDEFDHMKNMSIGKEDFQQGNLGILFQITWKNENELQSAMLTYLSKNGERIVTEKFTSYGYFEGKDQERVQLKYTLDMQGLVLESIGESINKNPESLTKDDLQEVETLKIDASESSGIYDVKGNLEHFSSMSQLTSLTLNQAIIPEHLLEVIPNLDNMTFIGPTLNDLSSVSASLDKITYLDIKESSFRGNAEDIMELENLEIVILDKSTVTDWEKLEQNGITVLENPPSN
ncbi:hypothetical protein SAMN05216232_3826 [Virgibacillus subterraneus]|uniref:Leucine-rich repeat domain-containing protein n=1 Tax=Virgibacillus subterraneus TaxID=621109 RepID=A0A1H9KC32_9BACI|nr:hypothetical protein [Virgibacillus subterraneus]SEQ96435.1 hypothetical protein SAMN05216232_3826 [Virgibacillus subterraneus]